MDIKEAIERAMEYAAQSLIDHGTATIPASHSQDVANALLGIWLEGARDGGREVIDQFKDLYDHLETKEDEESFFEQVMREFAEIYGGGEIRDITQTTARQIAEIVRIGAQQGLTLQDIAKGIREAMPGISVLRSRVISRTERHGAMGYSRQATARKSRRPLLKTWAAGKDHRTRDFGEGDGVIDEYSHRAMDGVTVAMDDAYQVPMKNGETEPVMFPGDPKASAGNRIMCRCSETYRRADK